MFQAQAPQRINEEALCRPLVLRVKLPRGRHFFLCIDTVYQLHDHLRTGNGHIHAIPKRSTNAYVWAIHGTWIIYGV